MPAALLALIEKLLVGPFAKIWQMALSFVAEKIVGYVVEAWKNYQKKLKLEKAKKEYEKTLDNPNVSPEERRKKFEEYINTSTE